MFVVPVVVPVVVDDVFVLLTVVVVMMLSNFCDVQVELEALNSEANPFRLQALRQWLAGTPEVEATGKGGDKLATPANKRQSAARGSYWEIDRSQLTLREKVWTTVAWC